MAVTTAEKPRSRSKLTKALAATGVGVALLAGGGGTFAKWYDEATIDGAAVSSGTLTLTRVDNATWTNSLGTPVSPATYLLVPGDSLTFTEEVTIGVTGDLIKGTLTTNLDDPAVTGDPELAYALQQSSTFKVNGEEHDSLALEIDDSYDGQPLTVELTVALPQGTGLENQGDGLYAQNGTVNLSALQVELTQTAPSN